MKPSNATQPTESSSKPRSVGRVRWWIVWTLFFSTVTNYISRQTFSVLAPLISAQYHLTHTDLAKILGAFQISYAVTWLLGGIFLDAVGTRLGLALAVVFWSVINILTGFASSVFGFAAFRFLLGIGEGFNWPGASKAVAEWFPSQERSLAVAIFDSGSSVGGAIGRDGDSIDRSGFWLAIGFRFFGAAWLCLAAGVVARLSSTGSPSARDAGGGRAYSRRSGSTQHLDAARSRDAGVSLARDRNVWGIVLGRALTDPIWWFYVFWLPQYLSDARGFSLKRIALFAWMPFIAADIGNFTGGLISGYCIRRGVSVVKGPHVGLRHQLPADSCRHSRRRRAQCLRCNGIDLFCSVGLRELVYDGPHFAVRPVPAGCCGNRYRAQWTGCRPGRRSLHHCCRNSGGSLFLRSCFSGRGIDASIRHRFPVSLDPPAHQIFDAALTGCLISSINTTARPLAPLFQQLARSRRMLVDRSNTL